MTIDQNALSTAVIGLGNMGSALASALLTEGHQVTVWNRTQSKANPLIDRGAHIADSVDQAVVVANVIVICVAEYSVISELLQNETVENEIGGKTLLQLGVVTAEQAQDLSDWATRHDVKLLEGSILGVPDNIIDKAATIICSGPSDIFETHRHILEAFGTPVHLSEAMGAAYQFDKIIYPFGYAAMLGFVQGAAMSRAAGYSIEAYTAIVSEWMKPLNGRLCNFGELIANSEFGAHQATLTAWTSGYEKSYEFCKELNVDETLPTALMAMLRRGIEDGYGDEELISVYKVLLPKA